MHGDSGASAVLESRLLGERMGLRLWDVVDGRLHHGHILGCDHCWLLLCMRWQTDNGSVRVNREGRPGNYRARRRHHEISANR